MEQFLARRGLQLDTIITDIMLPTLGEMAPRGTKHFFAVWHIAKGMFIWMPC